MPRKEGLSAITKGARIKRRRRANIKCANETAAISVPGKFEYRVESIMPKEGLSPNTKSARIAKRRHANETAAMTEAPLHTKRTKYALRAQKPKEESMYRQTRKYNALKFQEQINSGQMDTKCSYCGAVRWKNEPLGMCCAGGKVILPPLVPDRQTLITHKTAGVRQEAHPGSTTSGTYLYVKRATILDIIRKDLPADEINKLVFQAICEEQSIGIKYTKRLKGQICNMVTELRSLFSLHLKTWHCRVQASEFISREQFEQKCREGEQNGQLKMYIRRSKLVGNLSSEKIYTLTVRRSLALDVIREGLHLATKELAQMLFLAICDEMSVNLTFTERHEMQIGNYANIIRKKLVNIEDPGKHVYWQCKVLMSEFDSMEQFEQVCQENKLRQEPQSVSRRITRSKRSSAEEVPESVDENQTEMSLRALPPVMPFGDLDGEPEEGTHSGTWENTFICSVRIKRSTVAGMVSRNKMLSDKLFAELTFKKICEENSVQLNYTPRLQNQIFDFISKFRAEILMFSGQVLLDEVIHQLEECPPWACKVLVWEFADQKQFYQVVYRNHEKQKECESNDLSLVQLLWQRFNELDSSASDKADSSASHKANSSPSDKADSSASHKADSSASHNADSSTSDKATSSPSHKADSSASHKATSSPSDKADSSASHKTTPDDVECDQTRLNVKHSTIQHILKQNPDMPASSNELNKLVFEAICPEISVDLKLTGRLKYQISCFITIVKSELKLDQEVYWPCELWLSDFVKQEQFHHLHNKNTRDQLQEGSDIKEETDSEVPGGITKGMYRDINYQCTVAFNTIGKISNSRS
ncbi:uncharacterized protein [Amphiura filiformis]|uniref:uncharacterized protein n=1 Tax=Amphiura filiformis TaxID=82378 RepID=UPI003B20E391